MRISKNYRNTINVTLIMSLVLSFLVIGCTKKVYAEDTGSIEKSESVSSDSGKSSQKTKAITELSSEKAFEKIYKVLKENGDSILSVLVDEYWYMEAITKVKTAEVSIKQLMTIDTYFDVPRTVIYLHNKPSLVVTQALGLTLLVLYTDDFESKIE